jgi:hypothetical protein
MVCVCVCVCVCVGWHECMLCFYNVQYNAWKDTCFTYIRCAKGRLYWWFGIRCYELSLQNISRSSSTVANDQECITWKLAISHTITDGKTLKDKVSHQKDQN